MRRRFFVDGFAENVAALRGESAAHLARVLRAEPGHLYELSDGRELWLARVERVARERIDFALVERLPAAEPRLAIRLLLSIVKMDRFEWALEKATELGVSEIVPLDSERSERALVAAAPKRAPRCERILHESAQQSRRMRAPELLAVATPLAAFRAVDTRSLRIMLSERAGAAPLRVAVPVRVEGDEESRATPRAVSLAIGPEGGWTDAEFAAAAGCGFAEASLGENILRTETAVCAALAAIVFALG
ncbi:MAG: RsmE family RNA methyltransferase [Candidatus Acidiferrales bacterium]